MKSRFRIIFGPRLFCTNDLHSNAFIRSRINIAFQCKRLLGSHTAAPAGSQDSIDMEYDSLKPGPTADRAGTEVGPPSAPQPFPLCLGSVNSICKTGCRQHDLFISQFGFKVGNYFGTTWAAIISLVGQRLDKLCFHWVSSANIFG